MSGEPREDEWELSKENVQPLRQGRKFASLNAGLQPQSNDRASKIREEKQAFEAEIRTYNGDDPLDVWYRYVRWAEETFPKGGQDSNLTAIIESCAAKFNKEEKYQNDERYIYVWIKMADICTVPSEIYNFLFDQNIGCELSSFYEAWAWVLEQVGNTKRADEIYLEGLKRRARPYDHLKKKHEEFQKRVARKLAGQGPEDEDEALFKEPEREVLSQLKSAGKHHKAPANRTGAMIKSSAGVVGGARPKQQPQKGIQIFQDENQQQGSLQQTGEWSTVPKRAVSNKENEQKPGVWTKAKVPQPCKNVPISQVSSHRKSSFSVHVDESDQVMSTPAKLPEIGNRVLSSRKPEKPANYLETLKAEGQDNTQVPRYCKDKIYCGADEYSFEELRCVRWIKRRKEEEEAREMEECRRKLELERQLLKDEAEKVRQNRLQLQQEQQRMLEETRQRLRQEQEEFEQAGRLQLQRHQEMLKQTIQARMQEQEAVSVASRSANSSIGSGRSSNSSITSGSSARQLIFDEGAHGNTENIPPSMLPHLGAQQATQSQGSSWTAGPGSRQDKLTHQLNASQQLADNHSFNTSIPSASNSLHRPMSGGSTPTVNMKEAMAVVQGMFNTSLDLERKPSEGISIAEPPVPCPVQAPSHGTGSSGGFPFVIFDENSDSNTALSAGGRHSQQRDPGFQIGRDSPMDCAPKFQIPRDHHPIKSVTGFQVARDSPMDSGAGFQIARDSCSTDNGIGFQIARDPPMEGSAGLQTTRACPVNTVATVQPSSKQPLTANNEQFDMETVDHFQSHARDDITMAPVGSDISFAASAKLASTPFNQNNRGMSTSINLDMSDIEVPSQPMATAAQSPTREAKKGISNNCSESELSTANASEETSGACRNNLSPIMEGSSEDSDSHGKSSHLSVGGSMHAKNFTLETVMDQTEDTSSLLHGHSFGNQSTHVIDVSAYIPPEMDEKAENNPLSMSVNIDPRDPFDSATTARFLSGQSLDLCDNYVAINATLPEFKADNIVIIDDCVYDVIGKIGEGGFAKVYLAKKNEITFDMQTGLLPTEDEDDNAVAFKVQKPATEWEFYICNKLHECLGSLRDPVDMRPSVMQIQLGAFFTNGSCLVTRYQSKGTLLDMVNKRQLTDNMMQELESVFVYMTIELLHLVENLHKCQIIHGDIKPDNFLVLGFPRLPVSDDPVKVFAGRNRFAQLIDFGQSIDMTLYPPNTTFRVKVKTPCFQCIEMKTDRPWTYQTDLFGLAGTIHVLVFNQYMKVYQEGSEWHMTKGFLRKWNGRLWKHLFKTLLNVPSCHELPNLTVLRQEFEEYFVKDLLLNYNRRCDKFNSFL